MIIKMMRIMKVYDDKNENDEENKDNENNNEEYDEENNNESEI